VVRREKTKTFRVKKNIDMAAPVLLIFSQLKRKTSAFLASPRPDQLSSLLKTDHHRRAPNISVANSRRSKSDLVSLSSKISDADPNFSYVPTTARAFCGEIREILMRTKGESNSGQEITRSTRTRKRNQESIKKSLDFSRNMGLP
jgi:hypothetical protein